MVRSVLDPMSKHIDHAAFGNLSLKPSQKPAPCRAVVLEIQSLNEFGLGGLQEGAELWKVDAELSVVILGLAGNPSGPTISCPDKTNALAGGRRIASRLASHCRDDEAFESLFAGVGAHA